MNSRILPGVRVMMAKTRHPAVAAPRPEFQNGRVRGSSALPIHHSIDQSSAVQSVTAARYGTVEGSRFKASHHRSQELPCLMKVTARKSNQPRQAR